MDYVFYIYMSNEFMSPFFFQNKILEEYKEKQELKRENRMIAAYNAKKESS